MAIASAFSTCPDVADHARPVGPHRGGGIVAERVQVHAQHRPVRAQHALLVVATRPFAGPGGTGSGAQRVPAPGGQQRRGYEQCRWPPDPRWPALPPAACAGRAAQHLDWDGALHHPAEVRVALPEARLQVGAPGDRVAGLAPGGRPRSPTVHHRGRSGRRCSAR